MWTARTEELPDRRGLRVAIEHDSTPATYAEVLHCWQHDAEFRTMFLGVLAGVPYSAFRWETPPVTTTTVTRRFEFVLLDSPGLATTPDPEAFAEHFATTSEPVTTFQNLGKDAILVVPCPIVSPSAYGHLAAFVRNAPDTQKHAVWELVGKTMQRRLGSKPVWLSTAGAGVAWLHVRLDDRPKYYGYSPYRGVG